MSKLKVADLSFCETEFDSSEKVKGGMSVFDSLLSSYRANANFSSPAAKSDVQLVEQSLAKDGYKTSYFYDDSTGDFAIVASKGNGNAKTFSGVAKSYYPNGRNVSSLASASV